MAEDLSARMPVRQAQAKGDDVARSRQFEWLARAGLFTRGVIYAIIGILAIKLALGDGGKVTNQQGAIETIAKQPFGKALLILVAVGLAGYAIWRLVRAAVGHGPEASDDTKERVDGLFSGIGYALLCVTAVSILIGAGSGGSTGPGKATGGVLDWPAGQILVGIAGLIIIGVGLQQGYKGITRKFLEESKTEQMSERVQRPYTALGVFGHLARMVVFVLIGLLPAPRRDRLRPGQGSGPRRSADAARPRVLRSAAPRDRRGGTDRVRRVLDRRLPLPEGVSESARPRPGRPC